MSLIDSFLLNPSLRLGSLPPGFLVLTVLLLGGALFALKGGKRAATAVLCGAVVGVVVLSVLLVTPRPLAKQAFPDAPEVADATEALVNGRGYLTTIHGAPPRPPRYLPGFPLALAPFALVASDYPDNVQRGATFYAAIYVLCAALASWFLGGPLAGAIVAALIGISPFAGAEASMIMSDAFAAGIVMLLIPLLRRPSPRRIALAGVLAGALLATRLPMVVVLASLIIVLPWRDRKRVALFSAPLILALGLFNWRTYGGPLITGYDYWMPAKKEFSLLFALGRTSGDGPWIIADILDGRLMNWVCPCPLGGPQAALSNLPFYVSVLLGLFWLYLPPLLPIVGAVYAWEKRRELVVRFSFCVIVLSLVLFVFYFWQGARFMAAPVTLLAVFASAKIAAWLERALTVKRSEAASAPIAASSNSQ